MLNRENADDLAVIETLSNFVRDTKNTGNAFAYAIRYPGNDKPVVEELRSRPCYGEMRRYNKGPNATKNCTRPDDPWPSDLPKAMKDGERLAWALRFRTYYPTTRKFSDNKDTHNEFAQFVFSEHGPWRKGFVPGAVEYIYDKEGFICGVVQLSGAFDPTTLVSLCMNHRGWSTPIADDWLRRKKEYGLSGSESLFTCLYLSPQNSLHDVSPYSMAMRMSVFRFITGEARDLSSGKTWQEGDDYNRPAIQDLFMDDIDSSGKRFYIRFVEANEKLKGKKEEEPKIIDYFKKEFQQALAA